MRAASVWEWGEPGSRNAPRNPEVSPRPPVSVKPKKGVRLDSRDGQRVEKALECVGRRVGPALYCGPALTGCAVPRGGRSEACQAGHGPAAIARARSGGSRASRCSSGADRAVTTRCTSFRGCYTK